MCNGGYAPTLHAFGIMSIMPTTSGIESGLCIVFKSVRNVLDMGRKGVATMSLSSICNSAISSYYLGCRPESWRRVCEVTVLVAQSVNESNCQRCREALQQRLELNTYSIHVQVQMCWCNNYVTNIERQNACYAHSHIKWLRW